MTGPAINLRTTSSQDIDAVRSLYLAAFPASERKLVAELAIDLLSTGTGAQALSLVAETGDTLAGHIAFSPVTIDNNPTLPATILAPLAVAPDHQKQGVGSRLVRTGIEQLRTSGTRLLFVYGDPAWYGRFGFDAATATPFHAPCPLEYPFGWQAMFLDGTAGDSQPGDLTCVDALQKPELW